MKKRDFVKDVIVTVLDLQVAKNCATSDAKQLVRESKKTLALRTNFKSQHSKGRAITWNEWLEFRNRLEKNRWRPTSEKARQGMVQLHRSLLEQEDPCNKCPQDNRNCLGLIRGNLPLQYIYQRSCGSRLHARPRDSEKVVQL